MKAKSLPIELRTLVIEKIDSIGELEVLHLLIENPGTKWDAHSVSMRLRSNLTSAEKQLKKLSDTVLISVSSEESLSYWYPSADEKTAELLKDLPDFYPKFQHQFIDLIYNKPREHIQALVNSFKIGRGNKDG